MGIFSHAFRRRPQGSSENSTSFQTLLLFPSIHLGSQESETNYNMLLPIVTIPLLILFTITVIIIYFEVIDLTYYSFRVAMMMLKPSLKPHQVQTQELQRLKAFSNGQGPKRTKFWTKSQNA